MEASLIEMGAGCPKNSQNVFFFLSVFFSQLPLANFFQAKFGGGGDDEFPYGSNTVHLVCNMYSYEQTTA
jgi:hypothetical protein